MRSGKKWPASSMRAILPAASAVRFERPPSSNETADWIRKVPAILDVDLAARSSLLRPDRSTVTFQARLQLARRCPHSQLVGQFLIEGELPRGAVTCCALPRLFAASKCWVA